MSQNEEIRARLEREAVPRHVIDHVLQHRVVLFYRTIVSLTAFAFMAIGSIIIIALNVIIHEDAKPFVYETAATLGGILFSYGSLAAIECGIAAVFFLSSALAIWATSSSPKWQATNFIGKVAALKKSRFKTWAVRHLLNRLQTETDPARYVRRFVFMPARLFAGVGAIILAISMLMGLLQSKAFEIFTPDIAYVSRWLPWQPPRARAWASAVFVETGCKHGWTRGGTTDTLIYTVTFSDGTVSRLVGATPIEGSWLSAMEVIDRQLRASGVRFVPWEWLWNDPYHPGCIGAFRNRHSDRDFQRLQRLLRMPL